MKKTKDIPVILYPPPAAFTQDDCDCACALDLIPTAAQPIGGLWQAGNDVIPLAKKLSQDWQAFYNPQGPAALAALNPPAVRLLRSFQAPRPIRKSEATFAQPLIQTGLIHPVGAAPRPAAESQVLSAWLHLTDSCNLRCDYCYLPHQTISMSLETATKTVDKVLETALKYGYKKIKLKYAGGEPLLQFDLLQAIHAHAVESASPHALELEEVVLSNGTLLTGEKAAAIKKMGMRLMISLDGTGAAHDAHRKFINGTPTFARVEQAIETSLTAGLDPLISVTLSAKNLPALPETTAYLLKKNLRFSFNFYRENDCSQTARNLDFSDDQAIQALSQALQVIETNLPSYSLLGSLADRASFAAPHQHTCGAGLDYLVAQPSGKISKCQMDFANSVTTIHAQDPLADLRSDKTGLQNLPVQQKNECVNCQWKNYCGGGCPLVAFRATGRYDSRSPYCEIYKFLYPRLLQLEAQRLIFHASKEKSLSV